MKMQRSTIAKTNLTKKNKVGVLKFPNFKTYSKTIVIKTDTGMRIEYR